MAYDQWSFIPEQFRGFFTWGDTFGDSWVPKTDFTPQGTLDTNAYWKKLNEGLGIAGGSAIGVLIGPAVTLGILYFALKEMEK